MSRILACGLLSLILPVMTWADVSGTSTLTAAGQFDFETGAAASSGDLLINPVGTMTAQSGASAAAIPGGGGDDTYNFLNAQTIQGLLALATSGPISVPANTVLGYKTRAGHYGKLLVTAQGGGSITFKFTTYGATGGGGGGSVTIKSITNAAGYIPQGLPGGGIAQGSMFVIKGSGMGPANVVVATSFPLQKTIGGTSVKVTVGSQTVDAIMYYSLASQVAAILPSSTPTGTGTFTVTYNGQTSSPAPITVVTNAFSMFTINQGGSGDAIAFLNSDNGLVTPTHAVRAGEVAVIWGTGLGPVSGDETQPANQTDLNIPVEVYVGGKSATVLFKGRNACCSSVDTIYFTVPAGVTGCVVPVIAKVNNVISNGGTISIAASGRTCTPVTPGYGGIDINGILSKSTISFGGVTLFRSISRVAGTTDTTDFSTASFLKVTVPPGGAGASSQVDIATYGSCTLTFTAANPDPASPSTITYLDAGAAITLSGPGGQKTLQKLSIAGLTSYSDLLTSTGTYLVAGNYTATGPGGPNPDGVGAFTAQLTLPQPFSWTNQATLTTVNRGAGQTVTWTGGDPAGYVTISGASGTSGSATFTCTAKVSDGSFTIPSYVLLALPASTSGSLSVSSITNAVPFTARGLDFGVMSGVVAADSTVAYQ